MSMSLRSTLSAPRASAIATSSRCFTTSPQVLAAVGTKKGSLSTAGKKMVAGYNRKEKGPNRTPMGPMTHGIKLSYAMASPVPDLSDLVQFNTDAVSSTNLGLATTFPKGTFDGIRAYGLPRQLSKELTSSGLPASVIRQVSLDMFETVKSESTSSSEQSRYLISGHIGSGKSILLIQAVTLALATNHIVIYAPQTHTWIDGSVPFSYDAKSQTFQQPTLAKSMLEAILRVNGSKLSGVTVGDKPIADYIKEVMKNESKTVTGLEKVVEALGAQTEYPVFMAVDDVQTLFTKTKYRSPDYEVLQAYNLSMPRLALDYISGRKTLSRGTVMTAYSHTTPNVAPSPTFLYGLELPSTKPITPYTPHDPTHLSHATSGLKKIQLPYGMTTREANGMFEIWSRKGWAPKSNDELFMLAYSSSLGNPKELGRSLWSSRLSFEQFDPRVGEFAAGIL